MNISLDEFTSKSISIIENNLNDCDELMITVSDEERFVIMRSEQYNYLRECELELAIYQAKADVKSGDFVIESVDSHIKRITDDL